MNVIIYLFLWRLWPLILTGCWLVKPKSPQFLTNIWLVFRFLTKFWLSWKNSLGEDALFLKHQFCISFINFTTNIFVDQVVLKVRVLNQEKIPDQYYSKILDQKFKSWFTKYLNLIIKNKSRYIPDFFESLNNNASSSAVIAYFNKVFSIWISTLHTYILFISLSNQSIVFFSLRLY